MLVLYRSDWNLAERRGGKGRLGEGSSISFCECWNNYTCNQRAKHVLAM